MLQVCLYVTAWLALSLSSSFQDEKEEQSITEQVQRVHITQASGLFLFLLLYEICFPILMLIFHVLSYQHAYLLSCPRVRWTKRYHSHVCTINIKMDEPSTRGNVVCLCLFWGGGTTWQLCWGHPNGQQRAWNNYLTPNWSEKQTCEHTSTW